ncbi:MAG TPA: hypothetical protein VFP33_09925 [Gallionella sp.]|nr:hypothetical protein [Gallionella sp.]
MEKKCWTEAVTWLLVFIGWGVVHLATLARDRRKEKRETSMQLCKDIADLQSAAIDFHTAARFDSRKSTDLAQQVERIILRVQKKPLSELNIPLTRLITLRRKITQHNVDASDFSSQPADSEIILGIRTAISDLIGAIEDSRESVWE